jgi:hypothetical protein
MKKVKMSIGVAVMALSLSMVSCGGIDGKAAGEEYCSCIEKEGEEKTKCVDAWVEKYKGARGTEEEGKKMGEIMGTCNGFEAVDDIMRIAE